MHRSIHWHRAYSIRADDCLLRASTVVAAMPQLCQCQPLNRRGAGLDPLQLLSSGSKTVLFAWRALVLNYHAPAIYCRAFPSTAASNRGDYGRASDECMCGDGSCVNNSRPVAPKSARLHREDRGREPSESRCRHAHSGYQLNTRTHRAKMH
eukprot:534623-Pleurochrysis_carterae.AAC.5